MALKAIEREDEHHFDKQKEFRERRAHPVDVLFFGDSLTRRWEDNPELWEAFFGGFYPANFGVGADTLENMMWRVENGNLDGLSPPLVIILAGTNNLSEQSWETVTENIIDLISAIGKKLPESTLLVSGLYPRDSDEKEIQYNDMIQKINEKLNLYCLEQSIHYIDFYSLLLPSGGNVNQNLQPDGLHLNGEGYKLIGPVLKGQIEKLLK